MNKVLKNHSLFAVTQKEITKVNELPEKKVFQENANIDLTESVRKSVVKRLPWLIILLGLGIGVSATVGIFESLVKQLPAIMFFQSLILDMAGNVGTQSLAVAIRVLMDTELSARKKISLILKECRIGILNGGILGILSFIAVGGYLCLKGNDVFFAFSVSGCLGVAMVVAMAISAFAGTIIPVIFQKVGIDPAVASGPLITTVNDLVAVITYYGLSWIILINFFISDIKSLPCGIFSK